tara:strand:- start:597 stop:1061 length:465 start_codon:yes stop_codon:yes gene_type:complete
MRVGIVSGYFNPIHTGHLDYIETAKSKCDLLYVIVNNDKQVSLKGSKNFMDQDSRLRIVKALKCVDKAMIAKDTDKTVCLSIGSIYKEFCDDPFVTDIYFMNGGDRKEGDVPEHDVCTKLLIQMLYNIGGGKTESSSTLLQKVASANVGIQSNS